MTVLDNWKRCLINTCIRFARQTYPDLSLTNYKTNEEFKRAAKKWLVLDFFEPFNPSMRKAREALIREL